MESTIGTGPEPKPLAEVLANVDEVLAVKPDSERAQDVEERRLHAEKAEIDKRREDLIELAEEEGDTEEVTRAIREATFAADLTEVDLREANREGAEQPKEE